MKPGTTLVKTGFTSADTKLKKIAENGTTATMMKPKTTVTSMDPIYTDQCVTVVGLKMSGAMEDPHKTIFHRNVTEKHGAVESNHGKAMP
jgi:hypothetical protein